MLSEVDLLWPARPGEQESFVEALDWVICGCESGAKARPMNIEWARKLECQCGWANTPFFCKQLQIDGKLVKKVDRFPKDLQIQEYPEVKA
jgi:protein gp37